MYTDRMSGNVTWHDFGIGAPRRAIVVIAPAPDYIPNIRWLGNDAPMGPGAMVKRPPLALPDGSGGGFDGTEGQDRDSYSDDQDRDSYEIDPAWFGGITNEEGEVYGG